MKISRFSEYSLNIEMSQNFINSFDAMITESDKTNYKKVQNKIISDLKLNTQLISTFGFGITFLYPIVDCLMKNANISSIEITPDKIVLLTIAAVSIIFLEERKSKIDDGIEATLVKDSKSMLEELKMMGIGNGIVKKLIEAFKSIKNIFSIISKHIGAVISGFVDMFAYTSLLIPIMNGVLSIVGKYNFNLDTIVQNFMGLGMGLGTIITKHGIIELIDKLKDKFPINKKKVIDEIETPIIQKIGDISFKDTSSTKGVDLIKEQ
jgi:hypothetical protein